MDMSEELWQNDTDRGNQYFCHILLKLEFF